MTNVSARLFNDLILLHTATCHKELFVGQFSTSRPNPTHQLDPIHRKLKHLDPTQPSVTNNERAESNRPNTVHSARV